MTDLVVGVDIGATSCKALAVAANGTLVGRGVSGGGNPNSHPPELAAKRVAEAIQATLGAVAGGSVRGCMLGVAGVSKFTDPVVVEVFESALRQIGLVCPINVVSDAEVAFAAATASPDGTVVVSGTGSIAVRIVNRRKTSWVGGWGWLLGDEGSGYWIGREAVRATLRQLQGTGEFGPLALAVLAEAFASTEALPDDLRWRRRAVSRLITAANAEPPIRLARYASMVSAHAATDPAAARIVDEAAELLAGHALAARAPAERTPIVLAGSVIGPDSPVGTALRARLAGAAEVLFASDGALGAAWLAALEAVGPEAPRPTTP